MIKILEIFLTSILVLVEGVESLLESGELATNLLGEYRQLLFGNLVLELCTEPSHEVFKGDFSVLIDLFSKENVVALVLCQSSVHFLHPSDKLFQGKPPVKVFVHVEEGVSQVVKVVVDLAGYL